MSSMETSASVEFGGSGATMRCAGRDRGTPARYGCGGTGRRLELKNISEGVTGLILYSNDSPMGVVEELISDLWKHAGVGI